MHDENAGGPRWRSSPGRRAAQYAGTLTEGPADGGGGGLDWRVPLNLAKPSSGGAIPAALIPLGLLLVAEHPRGIGCGLGSALHAQLGEQRLSVVLDSLLGEKQPLSPICRLVSPSPISADQVSAADLLEHIAGSSA